MTDIAGFFTSDPLGSGYIGGDIRVSNGDLVTGDQLRTAVLMSLFTDRRAEPDDRLPDFTEDRRGWWGDSYADTTDATLTGDRIGSRLWLLYREKITAETIERARQYAAESLQWLIDDGVAVDVEVSARRVLEHGIHTVGVEIRIDRANGQAVTLRFDDLWRQLT